jgi:hypothetical protein
MLPDAALGSGVLGDGPRLVFGPALRASARRMSILRAAAANKSCRLAISSTISAAAC